MSNTLEDFICSIWIGLEKL